MEKSKMYRYLGRNGIITSPILLDTIEPIPMYALTASEGKMLTDGNIVVKTRLVFADELENWFEIDEEVISD